jgi:uncharacterized Zn finger protein
MSRYSYYQSYPYSKPRETEEGLKAKSKRGDFAKNWWATRWIEALEKLVTPGRLSRGRTYARKGQVLSIEEVKGGITAKVQGSRRAPYKVSLKIGALSQTQWAEVIAVLAEQALFTAQLLAGEMPPDIEEVFKTANVSLFPQSEAELVTKCSCPDPVSPCKHVAAVHYLLGERFDEDPFMIFRLRGQSAEQLLAAIRTRQAHSGEAGEGENAEDSLPLSEQLDHFWGTEQALKQFPTTIKPPRTLFPILKRLGQPSFLKEDVLGLLGPAYQAMTEAALRTAFGDEEEEERINGTD